jgi:curved DNA-binding protein CbpA
MAAESAILEVKTYYDVLGLPVIPSKLSLQEIKAAYHRALLSTHPDKVSGGSGAKVDLIREAWSILSDDAMRKEYDAKIKSKYSHSFIPFGTGRVNLVM